MRPVWQNREDHQGHGQDQSAPPVSGTEPFERASVGDEAEQPGQHAHGVHTGALPVAASQPHPTSSAIAYPAVSHDGTVYFGVTGFVKCPQVQAVDPSFYGGVITGFRVQQDGPYTGRIVFRFEPKPECRGVKAGRDGWRFEKKIVI